MEKAQYQELKDEMARLKSEIKDVAAQVYKNNFSSTQTFNKACIFNDRLKVPVFSAAPTVAEVGDLIAISGKLYICTTASTGGSGAVFTIVGTQV